jgi:GABA(A) receptor-associated protein
MTDNKEKDKIERMLKKYPDKVPIIFTPSKFYKTTEISKQKFLVPRDITMSELIYIIKKRISIPHEKAIFVFIDKIIPNLNSIVSENYEKYKHKDDILYIYYSIENTFG